VLSGPGLWRVIAVLSLSSILPQVRAEIPWPEVEQRLAQENEKLARRPQGHAGDYFVVCTLYYTPMESGFTAERGFDVALETKPGLRGRKYPREFLQAVKMEGYGRIIAPVNGDRYIRHTGGDSFAFAAKPAGHGGELRPRFSAAAHREQPVFGLHVKFVTTENIIREAFGRANWKITDTGGDLRRWQIDLYWGEDEPLGPGKLLARPRGTEFEYAYTTAKVRKGNVNGRPTR
jgi:hypothetical protein